MVLLRGSRVGQCHVISRHTSRVVMATNQNSEYQNVSATMERALSENDIYNNALSLQFQFCRLNMRTMTELELILSVFALS